MKHQPTGLGELDHRIRDLFHKGDENQALSLVYQYYIPRLVTMLHRSGLLAVHEAEEIAYDTVLRFFERFHAGRVDLDRPLAPLLYLMARNLSVDRHRKRSRSAATFTDAAESLQLDHAAASTTCEELELHESLREAIDVLSTKLSPKDQKIVQCCCTLTNNNWPFEIPTLADLEKQTGIPKSTLDRRLKLSIQPLLQKLLKTKGWGDDE